MLIDTETLGVKIQVKGVPDIATYEAQAGEGSAIRDLNWALAMWGGLDDIKDKFMAQLEELSGIKRRVNEVATAKAKARAKTDEAKAKVKDVLEAAPSYWAFVKASSTEEQVKNYVELLKSIAREYQLDATPSKRTGQPKSEDLEDADRILAMEEEERETKIAGMRERLGEDTPDVDRDGEGKPVRNSLARLVRARKDQILAQAVL